MLTTRNALSKQSSSAAYTCWHCRLQIQRRRNQHATSQEKEYSVGSPALLGGDDVAASGLSVGQTTTGIILHKGVRNERRDLFALPRPLDRPMIRKLDAPLCRSGAPSDSLDTTSRVWLQGCPAAAEGSPGFLLRKYLSSGKGSALRTNNARSHSQAAEGNIDNHVRLAATDVPLPSAAGGQRGLRHGPRCTEGPTGNVAKDAQADTLDTTSGSLSTKRREKLSSPISFQIEDREPVWTDLIPNHSDSGSQANTGQSSTAIYAAHPSMAWHRHSLAPAGGRSRPSRSSHRAYHNSRVSRQQAVEATAQPHEPPPFTFASRDAQEEAQPQRKVGIRDQLRQWQDLHGHEEIKQIVEVQDDSGDSVNNLTRLGDADEHRHRAEEEEEEERQAMAAYARADVEDLENVDRDNRFLRMGDLVELEFPRSERESLLAVFVQRLGIASQFLTIQGKWMHTHERSVQYSIPGWISPKVIEPLLEHLPTEDELGEELKERAFVEDLSVPREVSAPLISKMVEFHNEALEIYRKHASTLDNAHDLLAHETNLRYGSLVSAARTLLNIPTAESLPLPALFTVRKALMHAGFAFNPDRRSHRLTGHLQIRSKEQVRMVEHVRNWLRQWQEDNATQAALSETARAAHKVPKGAQYVHGFLAKARTIIAESREHREPTKFGNVGPSKHRYPITEDASCVRIEQEVGFSEQETELIRFMEAWACSNMFVGLPRVEALPPMLLSATGMYDEHELRPPTGFLFLQELGTLLPYENRVRFDQHLLLPSSQHSRPLQDLMASLLDMQHNHNLKDSMAPLRHDWKAMPVFCIDDASAHEIDDGLSLERIAGKSDEYWIHVHIANPTAFFDRMHPLAKMARHMGESIYMPERAYMMLPRWATQRHFSLGKNRPCLTFSARVDGEARMLEKKITPGFIRNVLRLTPKETAALIRVGQGEDRPETVLTVGGEPPPPPTWEKKSESHLVLPAHVKELKTMLKLAEKRQAIRRANGGLFFDSHRPEVAVWQSRRGPGLAWDHPYRKGPRRVHGDPVIEMRTSGFTNWFATTNTSSDVSHIMVREMMLLACEIGASWCADRAIPAVHRGTVRQPDRMDPKQYYREVVEPAMDKNGGDIPTHIGLVYVKHMGSTILTTKPLKHQILGLPHYGKVTSPLRRYGDIVLHWQIEAALREEARTGKSLVTTDKRADRSFLPFPAPVLQMVMTGLQPREHMISRAMMYAENFWLTQLLFRAHHFGETALPAKLHAYPYTTPAPGSKCVTVMVREFGMSADMARPSNVGLGDLEVRAGDWWECELDYVDAFMRGVFLKPVRLLSRWGE